MVGLDDQGAHHIPEVDGADWYTPDEHLRWLVRRSVGEGAWPATDAALEEAGTMVPALVEPMMPVMEANPPQLRQFDHRGQRADEVDYHPCFREVEALGRGYGLVRMRYGAGWRGFDGPAPVALGIAAEYLFLHRYGR